MDIELKNMMAEFKNTMLEKFDEVNNKLDTVDENLNKKIDAVNENLNKKIDAVNENLNKKIDTVNENLNKKIDAVNENLNKKIDAVNENLDKKINYVDEKQTGNFESLSAKLDYTNNNVALILQEQVKMREEMKKYNELNEKQHRLFEYEINNLKRYVV